MIRRFFGSTAKQQSGSAPSLNMIDYSPSVWLDAQDSGTIVLNTGKVSQWSDKSGNSNHAIQVTSARRPLYGSNTVSNGLNSIQITSGTEGFDLSSSVTVAEGIFVSSYKTGVETLFTAFSTFIGRQNNGTGQRIMGSNTTAVLHNSVVFTNQVYKNNSGTSSNVILPLPFTVCNFRFTATSDLYCILQHGSAETTRGFIGFHGEIVLFSSALDSTDRTDIINHLITKWGI